MVPPAAAPPPAAGPTTTARVLLLYASCTHTGPVRTPRADHYEPFVDTVPADKCGLENFKSVASLVSRVPNHVLLLLP